MKSKTKVKETEIGKIPEDWRVVKVGDVSKFQYGLGEKAQKTGEFVYIRITDINPDGTLNKSRLAYINKKKVKDNCVLRKGDVLVARTGATYGKTYLFREAFNATYGGFLIKFLLDSKIVNSDFLFQFSRSKMYWDQANNLVGGGAQPQFNANVISELKLPLPSFAEQSAITKILSGLDSKIELNNQMNKTLEAIGQALFKRWFVDFEFPNKNGKPYKPSGGEMVDSELGEIPKGWRTGTLKEIIEITSGKRPSDKSDIKKDEFNIPLIGASSIMGYVKKSLYNEPILIIGRVGTHGVVQRVSYPSFPSDNTLVIKSRYYNFVFHSLKRLNYNSLNVGTTQPLITQSGIKQTEIIIPQNDILSKFEKTLMVLHKSIDRNLSENETLSQIRDSLLPRLMSGRIRVM